MIKICYVVTIPLTIESFFIPQLRYLAENGFDVTVVCSNDSSLQEKLGESIRFYPIDIPRGISIGGSIYALKALTQFFKKEKFDLIQYSTPNAAFYSSIAAKKADCKVRNYHLMGLRYLGASGMGRTILKVLERIACHNSTSIECVSKSNMEMGINEGLFPREKVTVVWNGSTGGVDLSRFDFSKRQQWRKEIRKELGYSANDFVYGFVGRITKDKGINELIEAFSKLKNNVKLLIIGSPEGVDTLNPKLWNWANNSSNVIIHDTVTDIERYFAAMDVLVLPSYREGFGNVIIEAEAMGIPVVVTAIPGPIDTMIQDKTGLCCNVMDVEDLYEKLKVMVEDDTLRSQMGNEAYKYVSTHFDSEVLCQKILDRKKELFNKEC